MDFKKIKSGFTLVELIIVITVLAILATIAFVSFQSYTANARDSVRAVNLKDLSKAIELHKISTGKFPKPGDVYATGQLLGTNLFTVGKINSDLSKLLKFSKTPVDPVSGSEYLYGLNYNNKYFEVAGTFESQQASFFIGKAHADIGKYFSRIEGNYKGLMLFSTGSQQYIANIPSLIFSREGTYELIGNEVYFITHNGKNFAYSVDGQTTIQNQTVEEVLAQKTGKNVQIDYLDVQDWVDNSEQFVDKLGYQKDLIGFELFGKSYAPDTIINGNSGSVIGGTDILNPLKFAQIDAGIYADACGVGIDGALYCVRQGIYAKQKGLESGVKKVALSMYGTCVLMTNGGVKCYGTSVLGNGFEDPDYSTGAIQNVLGLESGVKDIALSHGGHACALLESGNVKCWGRNYSGKLGDGTNIYRSTPVSVSGLSGVKQLALGDDHTCALLEGGNIKCWGRNEYGQLGGNFSMTYGTTYFTPQDVLNVTDAIDIASTNYSNCALLESGNVKCWGRNTYGTLGDTTNINKSSSVSVPGINNIKNILGSVNGILAVNNENKLYYWGNVNSENLPQVNSPQEYTEFNNFFKDKEILQISQGERVSCVIITGNITKCWGWNGYKSVGVNADIHYISEPTTVPQIDGSGLYIMVSAGKNHTCGITFLLEVKCWGDNTHGQLGDGTNISSNIPVGVVSLDDTYVSWVAVGDDFSCVGGNEVYCWGDNTHGQLGNGTNIPSNIPIMILEQSHNISEDPSITIGSNYICYLDSENKNVYCSGDNTYGQLGDGTFGDKNVFTQINLPSEARSLVGGKDFICGVLEDNGGIYCWGKNDKGQLGIGNLNNSSIPTLVSGTNGKENISVYAGKDFACYGYYTYDEETELSEGEDFCWGDNSFGQYGNGDIISTLTPVLQTGLPDSHFSEPFQNTLRVYTYVEDEYSATKTLKYIVGDNSKGEYGNGTNISSSSLLSFTGNEVDSITFGVNHGCKIDLSITSSNYYQGGIVKCWGDNTSGQLGNGTNTSSQSLVVLKTE